MIEPNTRRPDNEHTKGEREEVVRLVGRARDVQKEHQVHPHLRDREHRQQNRDARRV